MDHRSLRHHRKRQKAERRFVLLTRSALGVAVLALIVLLASILLRGVPGFFRAEISVSVTVTPAALGLDEGEDIASAPASAYLKPVQQALKTRLGAGDEAGREVNQLVSLSAAAELKAYLSAHTPPENGQVSLWLPAASSVNAYLRGQEVRLSDVQQGWVNDLREAGELKRRFNGQFLTRADSRQPERAGFFGAVAGSLLTLCACIALAFPLGVMTACYLEEFARQSWLTDAIEVNINNLAAVPSIVFGLLGLAVYLNVMHLPRSSPLVGGLTLALMILPVIIIATRASLRSVPDSIRNAARALGATPLQVVWHHTLPLAMPGIMTGTILGMARAIGETAPLLLIGMVAFVADVPESFTTPATVMPVQIFLWAQSMEAGFKELTASGILVLLALLLLLNASAIIIRKRFEVRW